MIHNLFHVCSFFFRCLVPVESRGEQKGRRGEDTLGERQRSYREIVSSRQKKIGGGGEREKEGSRGRQEAGER